VLLSTSFACIYFSLQSNIFINCFLVQKFWRSDFMFCSMHSIMVWKSMRGQSILQDILINMQIPALFDQIMEHGYYFVRPPWHINCAALISSWHLTQALIRIRSNYLIWYWSLDQCLDDSLQHELRSYIIRPLTPVN
jgi:hypothetical protein